MEIRFDKKQVLKSERYRESRDVLAVLLKESQYYTIEEIDKIISDFSERVFTKREDE
jgi:hypothetical protein